MEIDFDFFQSILLRNVNNYHEFHQKRQGFPYTVVDAIFG